VRRGRRELPFAALPQAATEQPDMLVGVMREHDAIPASGTGAGGA